MQCFLFTKLSKKESLSECDGMATYLLGNLLSDIGMVITMVMTIGLVSLETLIHGGSVC